MTLAKNKLLGHLKKVVSNMDSRPLLQCINYNKSGAVYATDSHVVIKIDNFHSLEKELNINVFTLEIDERVYPDAERFTKFENITTEINVNIDILIKALKPFSDKNLLGNNVVLNIKDNKMVITSGSITDFKIEVQLKDCEGEIEIACQPQYLINGLQFIKDAKNSKKDTDGMVIIQFQSKVRPFKLTLADEYQYLITPVRIF